MTPPRLNNYPVPGPTPRRYRTREEQKKIGAEMAARYRREKEPSIRKIAADFRVSYATAHRLLKAEDVTFQRRGGPRTKRPGTTANPANPAAVKPTQAPETPS